MRYYFVCPFVLLAACSSSQSSSVDSAADAPRETSADSAAPDTGVADLPEPDVSIDAAADAPAPDIAADIAADTAPDTSADQLLPDAAFPPGPTGCMATQGTLTQMGRSGNVTVYSGCKTLGGTSVYLLVWGGAVGNIDQSALSTIKGNHSTELLQIPGVNGHGITLCCVPSTNDVCMSIYVAANTIGVWELADELDQVLAGEPDCFGIVAEVPGPLGPRCQPGPECLPIPTCDSANYYDPVCCTVPPYDPGASRVPTLPAGSDLEAPQAPGECSHDGECMLNGCGNHCVAYTAPTMIAICPCYPQLKDSFCGCVSGECVWYEQQ